jgi:hypothetical protein
MKLVHGRRCTVDGKRKDDNQEEGLNNEKLIW